MRVRVDYVDNFSLTPEEIIEHNKYLHGDNVEVSIEPNNTTAQAYLYLGIQLLLTKDQVELFFDDKELYDTKIVEIRQKVMREVDRIIGNVIIDNENRLS